jgi:hypothetical protein
VSKIRVPIAGTVGKSVQFDPNAGARAEAAVAALAAQISAGIGGTILHRNLRELQVGDDHPQYTGWQFPETIVGQWNFQTIPLIQGDTLAEYIQDVVGADFFDFLQDTSSVVWTYAETANELEANVPPEFVQDVIGGSLTTTASVALSYNDGAGTFAADVVPEFVQDTVGAMLATTSSIALAYNDGAGTFSASIVDEYVQDLVDALMIDSTSIAWTYGDVGNTLSAATINADPSGLIGMAAVNGTAATPLRSDGRHAIDPAIAPEWTANHGWADNAEIQLGASNDLRLYHDGTNSILRNDTGAMRFLSGATEVALYNASNGVFRVPWGFANGSAGSPSFNFDGASTTGLFNSGGNMGFSVGGTQYALLASSVFRLSGPALQITDGITAPGTDMGFASIYVDSADGDLKIKFGDGTVKTIVTDT